MHKLDLTIARLKLLLADVGAKRAALAATRQQYRDQIARLVSFAVHEDAGVDRTLAMMMEVDARLQELLRQEHYLEAIRAKAQYELESLQLTKLIEETRAQLAVLRQRQRDAGTRNEGELDPAWIASEIRRLEEVIAEASGAAAKSISSGRQ
jgi:hypothetical protein